MDHQNSRRCASEEVLVESMTNLSLSGSFRADRCSLSTLSRSRYTTNLAALSSGTVPPICNRQILLSTSHDDSWGFFDDKWGWVEKRPSNSLSFQHILAGEGIIVIHCIETKITGILQCNRSFQNSRHPVNRAKTCTNSSHKSAWCRDQSLLKHDSLIAPQDRERP